MIAEYILPCHRHKATSYIAFDFCGGNLINYIGASFILEYFNWRTIFFVNFTTLFVIFILWVTTSFKTTHTLSEENFDLNNEIVNDVCSKPKHLSVNKLMLSSGLMFLLIPAFARAALDSGVKSWVPTMITDSYNVSPGFATMLTAIIMIVNLSGVFIATFIYPRHTKNMGIAVLICFITALTFTLALLFIGKIHVIIVASLLVLVTTFMYTSHQLISVMLPAAFNKYGHSGSIASIINGCASLGVVAATFGFGILADKFGWTITIVSWVALILIAIILSLFAVPKWNKFTRKGEEI